MLATFLFPSWLLNLLNYTVNYWVPFFVGRYSWVMNFGKIKTHGVDNRGLWTPENVQLWRLIDWYHELVT